MTSLFDVIEGAQVYRRVAGSVETSNGDGKYVAVARMEGNKVTVTHADGTPVRVEIIDQGIKGVLRQVRYDSNNEAIYDITIDAAPGHENDPREWVARRCEIREVR